MLIDGKAIATEIGDAIKAATAQLSGRPPGLAVIIIGDNPASIAYVARKTAECQRLGIASTLVRFPATVGEEEVLETIQALNQDKRVDGILVQLPLPSHLQAKTITQAVDPAKDVDGFHPINVGRLTLGDPGGFVPCTPLGIVELLHRSAITVEGKYVVIVGRSHTVGKPLAALLLQKRSGCNATVTVAHSATRDLPSICAQADILIAAIGHPGLIKGSMVKKGATVIDVGINRVNAPSQNRGYRLVGDVAFDEVVKRAAHITPVPGGVGPMTVAMLMHNTWTSYLRRQEISSNP